ncbi:MAG: alpha/beta fold hydrolase [Ktedonobacteraceae bacterium]|nr:alpha/beta fold hydrolase [Ktedonobacteraceae bacterium]
MTTAKNFWRAALIAGGTLGALAIYNKVTETMAGELITVLPGEEHRYPWKYGNVFYKVQGSSESRPLVFIHGFGPGASSYEWRKNVDALAAQYRVYAIDLPGFGLSDHPEIEYSAEIYLDLIHDFLKEVVEKPAVVVARDLSCAYVIAGAFRRPQLFEHLILVSPPPAMLEEHVPGPVQAGCQFVLQTPVVGQFIYNLLVSRQAIRNYYDRQAYHNLLLLTDEQVEYVYTSAHQPASRYAMAAYLADQLSIDVREPLARLKVPAMALWGRESHGGPFDPLAASEAFRRVNASIDVRIFDRSGAHVQEERADAFNNLLREFAGAHVSQSGC